ncbi:hypothetical protein CAPTEDRAFT_218872 [Capitella teleta]|uniref:Uncharacterized protein n=1 Tax=Capitella teleta TaxID=283909 RepID=R7TAU0_CAPTE|nr:hypothetical protein CAPTEDRAFT_218872 [Capitella teleta]|eukprot:ELT90799.1 hypothetical protein CAPTEDRAFT_218872 [Capitella teleta]
MAMAVIDGFGSMLGAVLSAASSLVIYSARVLVGNGICFIIRYIMPRGWDTYNIAFWIKVSDKIEWLIGMDALGASMLNNATILLIVFQFLCLQSLLAIPERLYHGNKTEYSEEVAKALRKVAYDCY